MTRLAYVPQQKMRQWNAGVCLCVASPVASLRSPKAHRRGPLLFTLQPLPLKVAAQLR